MNVENIEKAKEMLFGILVEYAPKVIMAIVVLIVGFWIIARFTRVFKKLMTKREVEPSLISFLGSLINIGLKALLIISVASMVGIATTSFVAVLGAAGLAIGLAMQGSLANFAGGVLILMFKPFKLGDLINVQGEMGVVQKISVLNTIISTPSGNNAIIPNALVANDKIINFNMEAKRRVDLTIGVSYATDIDQAKEVLYGVLKANSLVLEDPAPFVGIVEFGDSSVNLVVRPYANAEDYWTVFYQVNEEMKKALDKANIEIPFPQRDINVKGGSLS